jgi:hypothetical protein
MHGMLRIRGIRGMLRMRSVLRICGMRTWWTSIPSVNMASLPRRLRPRVRMRAAAAATQVWGACTGETVGVITEGSWDERSGSLSKGKERGSMPEGNGFSWATLEPIVCMDDMQAIVKVDWVIVSRLGLSRPSFVKVFWAES